MKTSDIVETVSQAMDTGLALSVEYDGISRIVEAHAIGQNKAGRLCIRAYQTHGASLNGQPVGWKLFDVSKIYTLPKLLDVKTLGPREGYQRGDKGLPMIIKEL